MHPFSVKQRYQQQYSSLPGNCCSQRCHRSFSTDGSGGKCVHVGGNLEEPVAQDSILCSSCWIGGYRLLPGLLSQPFFVMFNLAAITGKEKMFCIGGIVTGSTGPYFSALTFAVVSMMAVERWLHMSRRSLLTVRRVLFLYATFAVLIIFPVLFTGRSIGNVLIVIFFSVGVVCIAAVALAYLKVFQIIRHHQHQIHTNANAIDMKKYKNSIFTILYILMLFVFSYVPYMYYVLVCFILQDFGKCTGATFNVCVAVMFSCSCFNPLLYYWRIKEIRDGVRSVIRKIFYKQNEEASS